MLMFSRKKFLIIGSTVVAALILLAVLRGGQPAAEAGKPATSKPALTVTATLPQQENWPQTLAATGNVSAWQEAIIGAEISNFRLIEILAQVGDRVKKGQVLARIDSSTIASETAEARASHAELSATLEEARANAERARQLRERGFFSSQQVTQSLTVEQTARARLDAARARLQAAELRLARTSIVAPDDGLISARSATAGSLTQPGQELFRLIRGGRLEWRAEVTAADLARLQPGVAAEIVAPDGSRVAGKVRAVSPSVDVATRNGLVYVDLPADAAPHLNAGMFARGEFKLGSLAAITLPQAAVVQREGFAYVFRIDQEGEIARTAMIKVSLGRRQGERIEITGLASNTRVVASGAGFLADGDFVRVIDPATAKPAS